MTDCSIVLDKKQREAGMTLIQEAGRVTLKDKNGRFLDSWPMGIEICTIKFAANQHFNEALSGVSFGGRR